jgi:hypothetical protein
MRKGKLKDKKAPDILVPGAIFNTKKNGDLEIVKYFSTRKVLIRFVKTGYEKVVSYHHIKTGMVKDKLLPSVCGVGFIGDGNHKTSKNNKHTKAYSVWAAMIQRCYGKKFKIKTPSYSECYACEEWHNFQNFAEWFEENYIDGFDIDKDILIDGNKLYSPETCMFVSHGDNFTKAIAKEWKFTSPKGEVINIYNLEKFCRENNLNSSHMSEVYCGKRKTHKNWRAA